VSDEETEVEDVVDDVAAPSEPEPEAGSGSERAVRIGTLGILSIILLSLSWYLASDRFTPYTTQARVAGYVVGVAPKVAGIVTEVFVENDTRVEAGQALFRIDPEPYRIAVDRARADVENARRQISAGDATVEAARAKLRAARANETKARQNADRIEALRADDAGTISERQLEGAVSSLEQASAQVEAARADVERAIEQMGGTEEEENAILAAAMTSLARAELDLANTLVEATTAGVLTDLRADVGQFAGTGSPVMTLIAIDEVWINAEFTENNLGNMRIGMPVAVLFDALPGEVLTGTVRSIGFGVSAGAAPPPGTLPSISNDRDFLRQAQRFPVIVAFDASDPRLRRQLRLGGQASVMAFAEPDGFLATLGRAYMRLLSWLSYAY
jgi:multidrug resistance efflux pump